MSDSAFVSNLTRPVDPTIWVKDSWWWVPPRSVEIIDWVSQVSTPPSSTVRMEGITSGHQIGVVEYRWYTVTTNPTFPVLYDQVLTLLQARVGDSGAPMFDFVQAGGLEFAKLHGIMVGNVTKWCPWRGTWVIYRYYSCVGGVMIDLGLRKGSR